MNISKRLLKTTHKEERLMIYLTGDIHASHGIERLSDKGFPEQNGLTKSDYVIICGDFGCVWDGGKQDQYWQDWLQEKPFTTLFVDGNLSLTARDYPQKSIMNRTRESKKVIRC